MYIIFVRNYKKKFLAAVLILLLILFALIISDFFIHHHLAFKVTINDYLTFSYPLGLEIDNVYVNQRFDSSVETSFSNSKPFSKKFLEFKSLEGSFEFSYPSAFMLQPQMFTGGEIVYHIDFHNKENTTHGFVQVWNLPYSLEEFLEKAKAASPQQFKYFNSTPIEVSGLPGYSWDYLVLTSSGTYFKGSEVFLKKEGKVFRISYFVPEGLWNKEEEDIYWRIVKSFKTF